SGAKDQLVDPIIRSAFVDHEDPCFDIGRNQKVRIAVLVQPDDYNALFELLDHHRHRFLLSIGFPKSPAPKLTPPDPERVALLRQLEAKPVRNAAAANEHA